jgi:hypothetical protein
MSRRHAVNVDEHPIIVYCSSYCIFVSSLYYIKLLNKNDICKPHTTNSCIIMTFTLKKRLIGRSSTTYSAELTAGLRDMARHFKTEPSVHACHVLPYVFTREYT